MRCRFGHGPNPENATLSNAKQLAISLKLYALDNGGRLPTQFESAQDLRVALKRYEPNPELFESLNPNGGVFVPNSHLAGLVYDFIAFPERTAIVYETTEWEDGKTTYAFVDVHAKRITDTHLVFMEPVLRPQD